MADSEADATEKTIRAYEVGLTATERALIQYVERQRVTTTSQASEALDIPARTVRRVLKGLADKGLLTAEGANRNRTYSLRRDGHETGEEG